MQCRVATDTAIGRCPHRPGRPKLVLTAAGDDVTKLSRYAGQPRICSRLMCRANHCAMPTAGAPLVVGKHPLTGLIRPLCCGSSVGVQRERLEVASDLREHEPCFHLILSFPGISRPRSPPIDRLPSSATPATRSTPRSASRCCSDSLTAGAHKPERAPYRPRRCQQRTGWRKSRRGSHCSAQAEMCMPYRLFCGDYTAGPDYFPTA